MATKLPLVRTAGKAHLEAPEDADGHGLLAIEGDRTGIAAAHERLHEEREWGHRHEGPG